MVQWKKLFGLDGRYVGASEPRATQAYETQFSSDQHRWRDESRRCKSFFFLTLCVLELIIMEM